MNGSPRKSGENVKCRPNGGLGPEPADAQLLAAYAAGKTEIFWHLWNRHQKSLRRLCLREMNGHTPDAEDALSQVMLKARDRLPASAGNILRLDAWLHRLAQNLCIDLRREHRRRSETLESWTNDAAADHHFDQAAPSAGEESEIRRQIAALPRPLREPFVLYAVREISSGEIAAQLGLTPANVRKRVQLARARLRRNIGNPRAANHPTPAKRETPPALPAEPFRQQPKLPELFPPANVIRTACVKLPCGVEQLFHVYTATSTFSPGRKIKSLLDYLLQHPGDFNKRLELAGLFCITGDWNKAVVEWQKALALRPHLAASLKLGETLLKLGRPEVAADVFKSARRQKFQPAATARHLDGWIAFCQKDAARSVMEFQAAAELEPENPVHQHGLALAHRQAGTMSQALLAIQRALNLNPNDLVALSLGHEMLLAAGEIEAAIRRAQKLLKLAPTDLLTMRRLFECRCRLEQAKGAVDLETKRLLRRMSRLSQNPFLIRESLAAFFLAQDEPQRALAVHREFVEQHPQCPRGRENYSRLLAAAKGHGRQPAEPRVVKLPTGKSCNGACGGHGQSRLLRAGS